MSQTLFGECQARERVVGTDGQAFHEQHDLGILCECVCGGEATLIVWGTQGTRAETTSPLGIHTVGKPLHD